MKGENTEYDLEVVRTWGDEPLGAHWVSGLILEAQSHLTGHCRHL
jgi:hypothetical protein